MKSFLRQRTSFTDVPIYTHTGISWCHYHVLRIDACHVNATNAALGTHIAAVSHKYLMWPKGTREECSCFQSSTWFINLIKSLHSLMLCNNKETVKGLYVSCISSMGIYLVCNDSLMNEVVESAILVFRTFGCILTQARICWPLVEMNL